MKPAPIPAGLAQAAKAEKALSETDETNKFLVKLAFSDFSEEDKRKRCEIRLSRKLEKDFGVDSMEEISKTTHAGAFSLDSYLPLIGYLVDDDKERARQVSVLVDLWVAHNKGFVFKNSAPDNPYHQRAHTSVRYHANKGDIELLYRAQNAIYEFYPELEKRPKNWNLKSFPEALILVDSHARKIADMVRIVRVELEKRLSELLNLKDEKKRTKQDEERISHIRDRVENLDKMTILGIDSKNPFLFCDLDRGVVRIIHNSRTRAAVYMPLDFIDKADDKQIQAWIDYANDWQTFYNRYEKEGLSPNMIQGRLIYYSNMFLNRGKPSFGLTKENLNDQLLSLLEDYAVGKAGLFNESYRSLDKAIENKKEILNDYPGGFLPVLTDEKSDDTQKFAGRWAMLGRSFLSLAERFESLNDRAMAYELYPKWLRAYKFVTASDMGLTPADVSIYELLYFLQRDMFKDVLLQFTQHFLGDKIMLQVNEDGKNIHARVDVLRSPAGSISPIRLRYLREAWSTNVNTAITGGLLILFKERVKLICQTYPHIYPDRKDEVGLFKDDINTLMDYFEKNFKVWDRRVEKEEAVIRLEGIPVLKTDMRATGFAYKSDEGNRLNGVRFTEDSPPPRTTPGTPGDTPGKRYFAMPEELFNYHEPKLPKRPAVEPDNNPEQKTPTKSSYSVDLSATNKVRFLLEDGFLSLDEFEKIMKAPRLKNFETYSIYKEILKRRFFNDKESEAQIIGDLQRRGKSIEKVNTTTVERWLARIYEAKIVKKKLENIKEKLSYIPQTNDIRKMLQYRYGLYETDKTPLHKNETAREVGRTLPYVNTRLSIAIPLMAALLLNDKESAREQLSLLSKRLYASRSWTSQMIKDTRAEIENIIEKMQHDDFGNTNLNDEKDSTEEQIELDKAINLRTAWNPRMCQSFVEYSIRILKKLSNEKKDWGKQAQYAVITLEAFSDYLALESEGVPDPVIFGKFKELVINFKEAYVLAYVRYPDGIREDLYKKLNKRLDTLIKENLLDKQELMDDGGEFYGPEGSPELNTPYIIGQILEKNPNFGFDDILNAMAGRLNISRDELVARHSDIPNEISEYLLKVKNTIPNLALPAPAKQDITLANQAQTTDFDRLPRLNPKLQGRTLVVDDKQNPGYLICYKFAKKDDSDGSKLKYERDMMLKVKELGIADSPEVLGKVHKFTGNPAGLPKDTNPDKYVLIYRCKEDARKYITEEFTDIPQAERKAALQQFAQKNMQDWVTLFKNGYIHTSLTPLTHEKNSGKAWEWYWDPVGGIENLRKKMQYSNLRRTGLNDYEHIERIEGSHKIIYYDIGQAISEYMIAITYSGFINKLSKEDIKDIIFSNIKSLLSSLEVSDITPAMASYVTDYIALFEYDWQKNKLDSRDVVPISEGRPTLDKLIDAICIIMEELKNSPYYTLRNTLLSEIKVPFDRLPYSFAFSPVDGNIGIVNRDNKKIVTLDPDGKAILSEKKYSYNIFSFAFSPTGREIGTTDHVGPFNDKVFIYGPDNKTEIKGLYEPYSVAFSPIDGKIAIADRCHGRVLIYSPDGKTKLSEINGFHSSESIAFSPIDGRLAIADAYADKVFIYSPDGKTKLSEIKDLCYPCSVAFNPIDGRMGITDRDDSRVLIYSSDCETKLYEIKGPNMPCSIAFSPIDGRVAIGYRSNNKILIIKEQQPTSAPAMKQPAPPVTAEKDMAPADLTPKAKASVEYDKQGRIWKVLDGEGNIIEEYRYSTANPDNIISIELQNIKGVNNKVMLTASDIVKMKNSTFCIFGIHLSDRSIICEDAGLVVSMSKDKYDIIKIHQGEYTGIGTASTIATWIASYALRNGVRMISSETRDSAQIHVIRSILKDPEIKVGLNEWRLLDSMNIYEQFGPLTIRPEGGGKDFTVTIKNSVVIKSSNTAYAKKAINILDNGIVIISGKKVGRLTSFDRELSLRGVPNPLSMQIKPSGTIIRDEMVSRTVSSAKAETIPEVNYVPMDPESKLDRTDEQVELLKTGRPIEFGKGLLYHERDGLDDVILAGFTFGNMPLTRVGHQWATSYFNKSAKSPAIFVINTEVFNQRLRKGEASLKTAGWRFYGRVDPYPTIHTPVSLDEISEIWVSEDTFERYKKIIENPKDDIEKALKPNLERLINIGKLKAIPGLKHLQLDKEYKSFEIRKTKVGKLMVDRNLFACIPKFVLKKEGKTYLELLVDFMQYADALSHWSAPGEELYNKINAEQAPLCKIYKKEESDKKALVLYADSMLNSDAILPLDTLTVGAMADLGDIIMDTNILNKTTIIVYGRKEGNARMVKDILEMFAKSKGKSIQVTTVNSTDFTQSLDINEAKELDGLIRHLRASVLHKLGIMNGSLIGVIKGQTMDKKALKRKAKELAVPVVSFKSSDGIFSFAKALKVIFAIKNSSSKNKEWFILLPPLVKISDDIKVVYENYIRALKELSTKA